MLAVIPARGGSKGIPRKNLRKVGSLSLIAWAANTVGELAWIDSAVISTDDAEMAEEGKRYGLVAPFLRPIELASDVSSSVDMWQHAWRESESHFGRQFDISILLQPTTPLRKASDVERTVTAMVNGGHHAAATVSRLPGHYAPGKCLKIDQQGVLRFFDEEKGGCSVRQSLPKYYYRNGVCYAVMRETLMGHGHIIEEDCVAVEIDEYTVDIDDPIEIEFAEFLLARTGPK